MKAIVQRAYGSPEVLSYVDVERPNVGDDDVLVSVHASSVNAGDHLIMRGKPWPVRLMVGLFKPHRIAGMDVAGTVLEVGKNVTTLHAGDEVFGQLPAGAFAGEVVAPASLLVPKPKNLGFEQAACVPLAGLTALHAMRDVARVQPGQRVMIIGASGGVGTFAVQIAKALGASVTGVCRRDHVETVRSIGADHVIDYTRDDFTTERGYDVVLDNAASRPLRACARILHEHGVLISNSSRGGVHRMIAAKLLGLFIPQRVRLFVSTAKHDDLAALKEMIEAGKITPVIDRTYALEEVPKALAYAELGHVRGKVAIAV
jgi:NADPH:quinone reductase-like Zn-dependent oxidoreductase